MFSNKMDFSSCVIWIDFYKSGHILRIIAIGYKFGENNAGIIGYLQA